MKVAHEVEWRGGIDGHRVPASAQRETRSGRECIGRRNPSAEFQSGIVRVRGHLTEIRAESGRTLADAALEDVELLVALARAVIATSHRPARGDY